MHGPQYVLYLQLRGAEAAAVVKHARAEAPQHGHRGLHRHRASLTMLTLLSDTANQPLRDLLGDLRLIRAYDNGSTCR